MIKISFYNREYLERKEIIIDTESCDYSNCINYAEIEFVNGQEEKLRYCSHHWRLLKGYYKTKKVRIVNGET